MNNKKTNIRLLINTWSKLKYSQISFNDKNINQNNIKQIKDCFNSLKLNDLLMDGLSTEKLEKTSEFSGGLNYSEIFHRLIKQNKISPDFQDLPFLWFSCCGPDYIPAQRQLIFKLQPIPNPCLLLPQLIEVEPGSEPPWIMTL